MVFPSHVVMSLGRLDASPPGIRAFENVHTGVRGEVAVWSHCHGDRLTVAEIALW